MYNIQVELANFKKTLAQMQEEFARQLAEHNAQQEEQRAAMARALEEQREEIIKLRLEVTRLRKNERHRRIKALELFKK